MITVRDAVAADAEGVSEVRLAGWRASYAPLLPPGTLDRVDRRAWSERTRHRIERGTEVILVAEDGGAAVGMCIGGASRDADLAAPAEVYSLYVRPERWSHGVAQALMAEALDRLGRPVSLWVLRENPRARRFYEKLGFRPDGSEQDAELLGELLPEVRYRLD